MASRHSELHQIIDSNRILKVSDPDLGGVLIKQYRPKPLNAKMIKYRLAKLFGKAIPIEYLPPAARRDFEKTCLALWRKRGFRVPAEMPVPVDFNDGSTPCLGIAHLDGERLDACLSHAADSDAQRLALLTAIFREMRKRHCLAIFEKEHRLIHYDANIRNVIIQNGQPFHIDFEMGHLEEDIDRSAGREVLKLSLQAANLLGRDRVTAIAGVMIADYGIIHILQRIVKEIHGAPFQALHRFRDRRRKLKRPGLVTKYDLADALDQGLTNKAGRKTTDVSDPNLDQALRTSWDGKFYQSLDDGDPRGRDMQHRYQVMQFPESFDGGAVLDIGCNIGRICVDASRRGAGRAVGIDFRQDVVDAMNRYYRNAGIDVTLACADINQGLAALEAEIGKAPFDYVFVLSIWSHVDQSKLWEIIKHYCARVMIFEDNSPSRVRSLDRIRSILMDNLDFETIDFLGFTTDRGVRAVFRLTRR